MRRIGIRELRQRASEFLRLVEAGESIEVTDRGRPVALLVPVPKESVLDRLERQGRLTRATGDLLDVKPAKPRPGVPLPSEILAEMRRDER
jgi:prevent-host-death family protein